MSWQNMTLAKLGFGTAQLMGRIGRKQSLRLMEAAFDAGIRHFDTAPLYGLGAAEGMVGEFARKRRGEITITTKFGIRPPARSAWMSMAKVGARFVVKAVPSLRVKLRRRTEAMTARGSFTPAECRESLHRSLQQLRTERIDFFLMHEVEQDQITGELLDTLEEAVQTGCIGRFGIATSAAAAATIARTMSCGTAAQFPSSVLAPAAGLVPDNFEKITHSALGEAFTSFHTYLRADKALQKRWSTALDIDCSDIDQLGRLFLYAALTENAGGTVVFSSLDEGRIQRNAALMCGCGFSASQVALLRNLVESQQWSRLYAS